MSTERQIAEILAPFLERHPEFIRLRRKVIRVPFDHLRVGFDIQRTAYAGEVQPMWFAGISFGLPPFFAGGVAQVLHNALGYVGRDDLSGRLVTAMEATNSSILEGVRSLEVLPELQWIAQPQQGMRRCDAGLVLAALGRFEEAEALLERDLYYRDKEVTAPAATRNAAAAERAKAAASDYALMVGNLRHVHQLVVRRDRPALAALFSEWEAQSVAAKKLQDFWQPTPFPFERTTT